jgi:hypothetical protein
MRWLDAAVEVPVKFSKGLVGAKVEHLERPYLGLDLG